MQPRPAQAGTNGAKPHASGTSDAIAPGPTATSRTAPGPTAPGPAQPEILTEILSRADIGRTIDRIAHQILERNGDRPVVLLGIPTRGVYLARRLAERLTAFTGRPTAVGSLDITLYRDDLRRHPPRALEETRLPVGGVDDAVVVLVDDVL